MVSSMNAIYPSGYKVANYSGARVRARPNLLLYPHLKAKAAIKAKTDLTPKPLLGSMVLTANGFIKDFSSHVRKTVMGAHFGCVNGQSMAALELTAGFAFVSGGLNVKEGMQQAQEARKVSDTTGKVLAQLKTAKGVAEAVGGAALIPARILPLAAFSNASEIFAKHAGTCSSIAASCFSAIGMILGIGTGIKLGEQLLFYRALKRHATPAEYLKELCTITPQEKEEIIKAVKAKDAKALEAKINKKLAKLQEKKEAYLKRTVGQENLSLLQGKEVNVSEIQQATLKNIALSSVSLAVIILGMGLTIASGFAIPMAETASTIFGLVLGLYELASNAMSLYNKLDAKDAGYYDKLWILLSSALAMIASSTIFMLSEDKISAIAATIAGSIWLLVNAVCYYQIEQMESTVS